MLDLEITNLFKRDLKLSLKRGKDRKKLDLVINLLLEGKELPAKYKDHPLMGDYKGFRDCHVEPDWLLIYKKSKTCISLARIGTHSDLFE